MDDYFLHEVNSEMQQLRDLHKLIVLRISGVEYSKDHQLERDAQILRGVKDLVEIAEQAEEQLKKLKSLEQKMLRNQKMLGTPSYSGDVWDEISEAISAAQTRISELWNRQGHIALSIESVSEQ